MIRFAMVVMIVAIYMASSRNRMDRHGVIEQRHLNPLRDAAVLLVSAALLSLPFLPALCIPTVR